MPHTKYEKVKVLNEDRKKKISQKMLFVYFAWLLMSEVILKSSAALILICLMPKMYMFFARVVVCISLFCRCLMTDSGFSWESLFIVLDQFRFLDH